MSISIIKNSTYYFIFILIFDYKKINFSLFLFLSYHLNLVNLCELFLNFLILILLMIHNSFIAYWLPFLLQSTQKFSQFLNYF